MCQRRTSACLKAKASLPAFIPARLFTIVLATGLSVGCDSGSQEDGTSFWFEDVASPSGVTFVHESGASPSYYLPEIMGGGVALLDIDNDLDLDIYFIQSGGAVDQPKRLPNELYLNDGTGQFTLTVDSGLEDSSYGMGVTTGDYDNDGHVDIFVSNVGENRLFRNNGDGSFSDLTATSGIEGDAFSTAALFADFDTDGYLDLFVVNYVDWTLSTERKCYDYGTGTRNYCDPGNYDNPTTDVLFRNNGDGTFDDVSVESGVSSDRGNGLGAIASDFNGDGLVDIYVANDKTPNHLWINQGDFKFRNEAFERGAAIDDHGIAKAGMGVAARDVDNDLDVDIIVVNIQGETDSYYRNDGSYFSDATAQVGLTRFSRSYTRFGVSLFDFDHDGRLDFYEGNGRVTFSAESATDDPYAEPNALFAGASEIKFKFLPLQQVHQQSLVHTSRGVATGDLDADGKLDLVVVNRDAPAYLLRNSTPETGTWLAVDLLNANGSPDLNAKIQFTSDLGIFREEVQVGGSYLAANSPTIHVTFHAEPVISSTIIRWSDGTQQQVDVMPLNRRSTIRRNGGL